MSASRKAENDSTNSNGRKPRHCREIKPVVPSFDAAQFYHMSHWTTVDACLKVNLIDETALNSAAPKLLSDFNASQRTHTPSLKIGAVAHTKSEGANVEKHSKLSRRVKDVAHVRDLKSQNYTREFLHAPYVNPNESERTGLCARNRLNGSLRDHSNAVALVSKDNPTKASNLQISRIPIGSTGTAEIAYQFTTLVTIGMANSLAAFELGEDAVRDPMASGGVTGNDIVNTGDEKYEQLFVMAHSASELLENTPRFLTAQCFLDKARALARAEINSMEISRRVHQTTDHLRFTCFRIIPGDSASDGTRIWFAWSLISYLALDPRLHTVLETWGFTEYDLAVAHAFLNYSKRLVGNRSRDAVSKMGKNSKEGAKRTLEVAQGSNVDMWKASSARFVNDEESEAESECEANEDVDSRSVASCSTSSTVQVVQLSDIAAATRVACTHELARKSRRIDSEGKPESVLDVSKKNQKDNARMSSGAGHVSGAPRVKTTLEFLHLHFSQNDGLLLHLYADTEDASVQAARRVLQAQLESKDINKDLNNTLAENLMNASRASAIQTRSNLQDLCDQSLDRSPAIVSWTEDTAGGSRIHTGLLKHPQCNEQCQTIANTRLLISRVPRAAQPADNTKTTIVWSCASTTTKCADETSRAVGCAMEGFRALRDAVPTFSATSSKMQSQLKQDVSRVCGPVLGPAETGITRSVVIMESIISVSSEVMRVAVDVSAQIVTSHQSAVQRWTTEQPNSSRRRVARTTGPIPLGASTPTPGVTPCNAFTVGAYLVECARTALNQIAPKQSLLAVPIAPESIPSSLESSEVKRVNPLSRPWCFLNVNDIKFQLNNPRRLHERLKHEAEDAEEGSAPPIHSRQVGMTVSATVTGDRAIDIPTALDYIADCIVRDRSPQARLSFLRQWRSTCFTAGIQCSTFHQFSNSVAAREMNTKIEGTSKIDAPDNHYLAFPTIYQAFVVGHTNLPVMFEGTAYQNTYGSGYECGAIASVGINGRMIVSDQRNAAFSLMDQTQVDTLCKRLAERGVVVCSDGWTFVRVPMAELGGLPRVMLPGVHLALAPLAAAFDNLRRLKGEDDFDKRSSIQVLPFSPFTQAVPPVAVCEATGMNFRDTARIANGLGAPDPCTSTECARPLRTLKKLSILSSDFIAPACVKMVCAATDNVFETIEPAVAPMLIFASQIGQIAKLVSKLCGGSENGLPGTAHMSVLRRESMAFVDGSGVSDVCISCLVLDALVLFNCMFPLEFEVGNECLLRALEGAHAAFFENPKLLFDETSVQKHEDTLALRRFCYRLFDDSEKGPWNMISDFVVMVSTHASKFENTEKDIAACSRIVDSLGKIVWLLHSDDGVNPPEKWSPLHCRATPNDVIAADLVCVWVDRPKMSASNRRRQRGALFGLPNAGPQQVLMLLTGAFLKGVRVQYARNEGNMCLRMSACALKDGNEGAKLTAKSTSPIYSDNDCETFGTLTAKEEQAKRQVVAWRKNNDLVFEVATQFDEPGGFIGRFAGSEFNFKHMSDVIARWKVAGAVSTEELEGVEKMKAAASFI